MTTRLALVGGGNMGAALLGGLIASGWASPDELSVVEVSEARRHVLVQQFPGVHVTASVSPCEAAVIAVKLGDVASAVGEAVGAGATRVLSIAAGVSIARLEAAAGRGVSVVRSMPNTPALVGQGAAAIAGGASATDDDLVWAERIL